MLWQQYFTDINFKYIFGEYIETPIDTYKIHNTVIKKMQGSKMTPHPVRRVCRKRPSSPRVNPMPKFYPFSLFCMFSVSYPFVFSHFQYVNSPCKTPSLIGGIVVQNREHVCPLSIHLTNSNLC